MEFADFLQRIGANVRKARWAANLTQEELAAKTITLGYLRQIERGTRNPSAETLFVLARALNVTPATLIDVDPAATDRAQERLRAAKPAAPKKGRKPKATKRSP